MPWGGTPAGGSAFDPGRKLSERQPGTSDLKGKEFSEPARKVVDSRSRGETLGRLNLGNSNIRSIFANFIAKLAEPDHSVVVFSPTRDKIVARAWIGPTSAGRDNGVQGFIQFALDNLWWIAVCRSWAFPRGCEGVSPDRATTGEPRR